MRKFKTESKVVKGLECKANGRSSDFISPSFIYGCAYGCKYCTVYRNNPNKIQIATNVDEILESIEKQYSTWGTKIPNQCGNKWTLDISCNTDICLHFKQLDWFKVFDKLISIGIMPTFATKKVNYKVLDYNPLPNTIRIRYSLLPQRISNILTPKGDSNLSKFAAINQAVEKNWQVHLNFSPIVLYKGWLQDYEILFKEIKNNCSEKFLNQVQSEVIFLTHNENLHNLNVLEGFTDEYLLWQPNLQEDKISSYGSKNLRYKVEIKQRVIEEFKVLYTQYFGNTIRYIF